MMRGKKEENGRMGPGGRKGSGRGAERKLTRESGQKHDEVLVLASFFLGVETSVDVLATRTCYKNLDNYS
jgi:hypothetical protein